MPPRIRRETPDRREARIRKHLPKAREYWSKWPAYLAEGDLCQAGEKGWDAVAQLVKAVAAHRGWVHTSHEALLSAVRQIADESPDPPAIRRLMGAAERLHGNFYEAHLDYADTELAIADSGALLEILWRQLPDEYIPAPTFAQWIERESETEPE